MQDGKKPKAQLIAELAELRRQVADLKASGTARSKHEEEALTGGIDHHIRTENRLRAANALLAVERNKLTSILEAMQDGVYIIQSDHSIQYINPIAVREFGAVDGKKCYEYFNLLSHPCEWCSNEDTYRGGSTRSIWACARNRKTYDVFDTPIRNEDGTVSKLSILHDVTEHCAIQDALRLDEARLQALLDLGRMTESTLDEITGFALEQQVSLTGSALGFLGFLDDGGDSFTLHAISNSVPERGLVTDSPHRVPLREAGLWADVWNSRKPVIANSFRTSSPRLPVPSGNHGPIERFMSVPIFAGSRVAGVAAVADKGEDYDLSDLRQLTLLVDGMWRLIERRKDEESLRESEKQLRFLSAKLLTVWESERERLAQELHDRIGQTLAAVKFGVENSLNARGRGKTRAVLESLQGVIPLLQEAMREVRNIYMHLRPTILDDFGVIAAIGWFCREFGSLYPDVFIDQEVRIREKEVPEALKIVIYRIVQEALTNMARHSRAKRVWLTVAKTKSDIDLAIRDNGRGFDPKDILAADDAHRGLGLASMQEQAKLSGGTFTVESSIGEGTLVRATWPADRR